MLEILNIRLGQTEGTYIINGYYLCTQNDENYSNVQAWINADKEVMPALTPQEIAAISLNEKWNELQIQWDALTVTTPIELGGHTFAANKTAMENISFKANNMGDAAVILWVEDWGTFNTNTVELKAALNIAMDSHQALFNSIFGA